MKFRMIRPTTEFGRWIFAKMDERDMNCSDMAKKLYTTRQTVYNHISGNSIPNYPFVIAYCSILGDDPENIWKLVKQEKG